MDDNILQTQKDIPLFLSLDSQNSQQRKGPNNKTSEQQRENEKEKCRFNQKKKKQVKILSGFFPVFIFFSIQNSPQILSILNDIKFVLQNRKINFDEIKEKHMTLTKTINILESQIKEIHAKVQKSLKGRVILPIVLLFKKVRILSDFVCLEVEKVTALKLQKMTQIIVENIKQPYFQNPIYHVSLFKLLQEPSNDQIGQIENIKLGQKTAILLQNLYMNAGIKKIKMQIK